MSQSLYAHLCLITGNRAEAKELSQDAFLKVWERWDRVAGMEKPIGYLYRTAMNLFRKRYRRAVLALRKTEREPPTVALIASQNVGTTPDTATVTSQRRRSRSRWHSVGASRPAVGAAVPVGVEVERGFVVGLGVSDTSSPSPDSAIIAPEPIASRASTAAPTTSRVRVRSSFTRRFRPFARGERQLGPLRLQRRDATPTNATNASRAATPPARPTSPPVSDRDRARGNHRHHAPVHASDTYAIRVIVRPSSAS